MNLRLSPVLLALAVSVASASGTDAEKYTPEIHGMLTNGKQPVAANVCLRETDSEIRTCAYADASGRFFIPASGSLHPARLISDEDSSSALRSYWLETGNVLMPQKLWPIDLGPDRYSAIDLDCDLSRRGQTDPTFRSCEVKSSKQLVNHVPLDDTPYRMARPVETPKN